MADALPQRNTDALHRGRISLPGARYFVTVCARRPTAVLVRPEIAPLLDEGMSHVLVLPDARRLCSTSMPDHLHIVLELGSRISIGQLIGNLKTQTRRLLAAAGGAWQRDFFEHRLRPDDSVDAYARYVFMNPYRQALLQRQAVWPWWRKGSDECFDFESLLESGRYPPTAWLENPDATDGLNLPDVGLD